MPTTKVRGSLDHSHACLCGTFLTILLQNNSTQFSYWSQTLQATKKLFIWRETFWLISHLSEIPAEWWNSLYKSKSFIWEQIHLTQVRSHLNAGEISLRWDDFSPNSFSRGVELSRVYIINWKLKQKQKIK